jgi:D-3-phosphoglycerate dehydrogenase
MKQKVEGRVLVCDGVHDCLLEGLASLGYEVDYRPNVTLSEVDQCIAKLSGIVINSRTLLPQERLEKATSLRFIARLGSGMEIVDVPYATSRGIACLSAPEGNAFSVAEQALAAMLSWMNNMTVSDRYLRNGSWERERFRGRSCQDTQLGIIGYGHTGKALAQRAKALGMTVYAYDKYHEDFHDGFALKSNLSDLQHRAHVVSLHLPLTEETKHYVNESFLSQLQPGTMLINTSRGAMIELDDTLKALDDGHLDFLYCDVLPYEGDAFVQAFDDENFRRFIQHPKVSVSPHVAGWSFASYRKLSEVLLEKIRNLT